MEPNNNIYESEKLKWTLISRYSGIELNEAIEGKEIKNERGTFYRIESGENIDIPLSSNKKKETENKILRDLRLVKGIGRKTEKRLKEKGIRELKDLTDDKKYKRYVSGIIDDIKSNNIYSLQKRIGRWHSNRHPMARKLLNMVRKEDLVFFDIETLGLRYKPTFLIGIGSFSENQFKVKQFLARNLREEEAIISEFCKILDENKILVSYNGRCFDSRFLKERMELFDIKGSFDISHFDLFQIARGMWTNEVSNHKLITLEKEILGQNRTNDVSSAMVPHFYEIYLNKGNPGPLVPILEHNRKDIASLVKLFKEILNKC